ncbi:MAG TPA: VOC family protein [Candidatus Acidoferrales bacterium]|nr:VOC family protein [Candidatus Acidoferrales bacterium]
MQLIAHVNFNGNCEEAFNLYAQALGGKIQSISRYSDAPGRQDVPPEWGSKVMHVMLVAGDQTLMGCDAPPSHYHTPAGIIVTIQLNDIAATERIYNALTEGAKISMPLQETFWSPRFGMFTDRFGIPWMVNCRQVAQQSA